MGSREKFCLRWNDFSENFKNAVLDLRSREDFFDVTLAVDGRSVEVVRAHKVILAACSPFFHSLLADQAMASVGNPIIFLRGIRMQVRSFTFQGPVAPGASLQPLLRPLQELRQVLDFVYQGQVDVAQEDLDTFLSVAEDLKIKGLTQSEGPEDIKEESCAPKRRGDPPDHSPEIAPPAKKRSSQGMKSNSTSATLPRGKSL